MSSYEDEPEAQEPVGAGNQTDLLKSYLAFAKRAISRNWMFSAAILVVISAMTIVVAKFWPRTYHCETRLMADQNDALAGHGGTTSNPGSLRSATNVITRHENLEAIIKRTDLVHVNAARRPIVLKLKDRLMEKIGGKMSEEDAARALVWTLEQKLFVDTTDQSLTIGVNWADPQTAALLVQNALDNFLDSRHVAEISAIAEYISILEGHATTLRNEVETIAAQIQDMRKQRRDEAKQKLKASRASAPPTVVRRPMLQLPKPSEEAPSMRVLLDAKRQAIADLEATRQRRLLELQSKLDDLKMKYTAAHPVIEDLQQQVNALSHESPQVITLRAEVRDLEAQEQKRVTSIAVAGSLAGGGVRSSAVAGDVNGQLPDDIVNLLNAGPDDDVDPAVGAQFGYAVAKYTTLRTQVSEARIELDTAQAAFNRRYKVVSPAEVPDKPIKPKVPVIIGVGMFLGLALAALAAIGLELREGKIVERWQIQQLALPVLAELRFPPSSSND